MIFKSILVFVHVYMWMIWIEEALSTVYNSVCFIIIILALIIHVSLA